MEEIIYSLFSPDQNPVVLMIQNGWDRVLDDSPYGGNGQSLAILTYATYIFLIVISIIIVCRLVRWFLALLGIGGK